MYQLTKIEIPKLIVGDLGVGNSKQEASIGGAVAAAHYIRAVAPLYGVPVVLHTVRWETAGNAWRKNLLNST